MFKLAFVHSANLSYEVWW